MRTVRLTVQVFGLLLAVYSWGFHSTTGMAQAPVAGEISPQQYEVVSELNQKAPMRDGVTLTVDIFRPKAEGRFPAIVYLTPYNKTGNTARGQLFASRGYVVINADTRGRFESGGDWDPFSPLHKQDGYDLVEWAAVQTWSTGKVGCSVCRIWDGHSGGLPRRLRRR